ncbi:2'-5' RNA ligase family protein [Ideonella sp. DXS29W]|uniref:2'-5' RNA ligase family protein n=1 Tax=Ideonella lacteola TaxID=2984193 RepID=A0ABU9BUJ4_9BURK
MMPLDPPAPTTGADRLFFAVLPDDYASSQADRFRQRFCQQQGVAGTPVRPEHLHVTLCPLGPQADVSAATLAMAAQVAAALRMPPFEVEFDAVTCLRRTPPGGVALASVGESGLRPLLAFQQTLAAAMARGGLGESAEQIAPLHMTLVQEPTFVEQQFIRPIAWTVRELVLIHSAVGQMRPVTLGRWPLYGAVRAPALEPEGMS